MPKIAPNGTVSYEADVRPRPADAPAQDAALEQVEQAQAALDAAEATLAAVEQPEAAAPAPVPARTPPRRTPPAAAGG